ncbi:MAG: glycosyl hydrolase family 18 protein, partial [Sulfobacillus thermotolerans]|nr:glycosyl hydrolase family 18 protein [Sulfobacillus thermotolerans]
IQVTTAQGIVSNDLTFAGVSRGSYALSSNGTVTPSGNVPFYGDLPSIGVSSASPAVQLIPTANYQGYWILTQNGQVYAFGNATPFTSNIPATSPAISMAATPSGQGAFVLTQNGTVYALGNAQTYGNATGSSPVSIASTPNGLGYWVVSASGVVQSFGDAENYGSLPQTAQPQSTSVSYPNGTLLRQNGTSPVWVVENGTLHHIPNPTILLGMGLSWSQVQVVSSLSGLSVGAPLVTPYTSGTLLQQNGQSAIYLVMNGILRHIASASVFTQMGLSWSSVVHVNEISPNWPIGPALTVPVAYYPSGTLLKAQNNPAVYMVNNGTLEHIMSGSVLSAMGYQWSDITVLPTLPNLPIGQDLTTPMRAFPTGTLVRQANEAAVYLVQNGTLRHIVNPQALYALGFTFAQVVVVPTLEGLPTGSPLDSTSDPTQAPSTAPAASTNDPPTVVGFTPTSNGQGYWILQSNGVVTTFGNAQNFGEPPAGTQATQLVVSVDQQGYDVITADGQVLTFGDGPALSVPSSPVSVIDSPMPANVPAAPSIAPSGFLSMGYGFFVDNFPNGVNNSSYEDLLQHGNSLSAINPAWFNLAQNADGSWQITSWSTTGPYAAPDINGLNNIQVVTAQAQQEGVMVLPSIGSYYNPANGPITTAADDANLVQQIVSLVTQDGFNGITIDFENNGYGGLGVSAASTQYTTFIQQLGTALHAVNKLLMVAVYPSSYPNTLYNYQAIAPYVNYINMMTYPEDNSSTFPGPTAGFPWVESLVQSAIADGVNPQQIILGLAPYGHEWTATNQGVTGVGAVSNRAVQSLLQQQGISPLWDPTQDEIVFTAGPLAQLPPAGYSIADDNQSLPQVANLQNLLNFVLLKYAIDNNQTPRALLPTDGYYGPLTTAAVTAFQQDFNVQGATAGVYDTATAQALQQLITQWNIGQDIYWDETSQSIADRVQLALQNNLGGVAAWRLPFETPGYWTAIGQLTPVAHLQP